MKINNHDKELGQLYLYRVEGTGGPTNNHTFCYYITPDISLWSEMECCSENNNGDITGTVNLLQFSQGLTVVSRNKLVSHNKEVNPLLFTQAVKDMYKQLFNNFLPTDHWIHERQNFYMTECINGLTETGLRCVIARDNKPIYLKRLKFK